MLGTYRERLSDARGQLTYGKALLETQLSTAKTSDLETEEQQPGLKRQSGASGPRTEPMWGAGGEAAPSCHAEGSPGPCWCGVQAGMSLRQKPLLEAPRRAQPARWGRTPSRGTALGQQHSELIRSTAGLADIFLPFLVFALLSRKAVRSDR